MKRKQSVLQVEILLDPIPGWGHEPEDHPSWLRKYLEGVVPHYNPKVTLLRVEEIDV